MSARTYSFVDSTTDISSLTRGSVATYFDATGTIQTVTGDVPRLNHHEWNGSAWVNKGLLIESEGRTNLLSDSANFSSGAAWSSLTGGTISGSAATGPDGLTSAFELLSAANTRVVLRANPGVTFVNGTTYTASVIAKQRDAGSYLHLLSDSAGNIGGAIDLANGSILTTFGAPVSFTTINLGGGWYQVVFTWAALSDGFFDIRMSTGTALTSTSGVTGQGIYVWGAQVEVGATPSSYIPTAGTTVTRAAESVVLSDNISTDAQATITVASGTANFVTDFPMYLDLADMPSGFWGTVESGGGSIRIFKDNGDGTLTECPREVVSCDPTTDTGELHAKTALSNVSDNVFYLFADGTSADYAVTDTFGRNAVWSGSAAKFHFEADATDSTGNTTATHNSLGTVSYSGGAVNVSGGAGFDVAPASVLNPSPGMRFSAWVDLSASQVSWAAFMRADGAAHVIRRQDTDWLRFQPPTSSAEFVGALSGFFGGGLKKLDVSSDGSTASVYVDGSFYSSLTHGAIGQATSLQLFFENSSAYISGSFYSVGIEPNNKSADWIATEYANQSSPSTFYTVTAAASGGTTVEASTTFGLSMSASYSSAANASAGIAETISLSTGFSTTLSVEASITESLTLDSTASATQDTEAAIVSGVAFDMSAQGVALSGAAIEAAITAATTLGGTAEAQASAAAAVVMSQELATQVAAQALTEAGVSFATIQSVSFDGSTISADYQTPDGRVFTVRADTRLFIVT